MPELTFHSEHHSGVHFTTIELWFLPLVVLRKLHTNMEYARGKPSISGGLIILFHTFLNWVFHNPFATCRSTVIPHSPFPCTSRVSLRVGLLFYFSKIYLQIICYWDHGEGRRRWPKREKRQCGEFTTYVSSPIVHRHVIGDPLEFMIPL